MVQNKYYYTREVSTMAGIHRDTLLRWLREGKLPEPKRDRNNWRIFSENEVQTIINYVKKINKDEQSQKGGRLPYSAHVRRLEELDWDYIGAKTEFLNHSIHPYPCKFIPQIPNTLIQELSSIGDTVMDPFAGSGTTLVEALRLGRNAIGIDANPLSALICKVKSTKIQDKDAQVLSGLADDFINRGQCIGSKQLEIFADTESDLAIEPDLKIDPWIYDWFARHVIHELAQIKGRCLSLGSTRTRDLALLAFSSIIVTVSMQDSDTRYVRRGKNIGKGDTFRKFGSALHQAVIKQLEFSEELDRNVTSTVISANLLDQPEVPKYDLLVCSPPYPNAFSYHLYHRSRMLWLGMDPVPFKQKEIGSHRKYSSKGKNAATKETFEKELELVLAWISKYLRDDRHACFVIGDSTIRGKKVRNDELLIDVAEKVGFVTEANISRNLQATKKSFNPSIGKIKDEHIVILRKAVG